MGFALGLGIGLGFTRSKGGGVTYLPEAQTLFARMTTEPDATRKGLINTLIGALIAAGVWSKMDAFYVTAAHDAQAARRNWIADAYNLTASGSPAFAADRGYTGDGVGARLATGFSPSTAPSSKHVQDNASIGFWSRTTTLSDNYDMGGGSGGPRTDLRCLRVSGSGNFAAYINDGTFAQSLSPTSTGLFSASRVSNSERVRRVNKGFTATDPAPSGTPTASELNLLANLQSNSYSIRQCAAAWIGAGLSQVEHNATYDALNTYLTAIGAA